MAATLIPYPPHHPQQTHRITPSVALANISSYLSASETTPHLHPDAQLDPREIKFSTTGGPSGGLVLHNLRRVSQGLNGEVLAPEKDELDDIFGLGAAAVENDGENAGAAGRRKGGLKKTSVYDETDAQDPVEYAQSQQVLEGEVGDRDTAMVGANEDEAGAGALTQKDKAARKEEKKRRLKAEKKAKEEQRAANK